MKLPIPIFSQNEIFTDCVLKRPTAGVLADTQDIASNRDEYSALAFFVSNSISELSNDEKKIDNYEQLKHLIYLFPYKTIEYLSVMIAIMLNDGDDGVEGIYTCSMCGEKIVCKWSEDFDTQDHLNEQEVVYGEERAFIYDLKYPIENKEYENITSMEMFYPTIRNCIDAGNAVGRTDNGKLQREIYNQALSRVNGVEVDGKFKSRFGQEIFRKMDYADLKVITEKINQYGIKQDKKKTCKKCGHEDEYTISTSNFFARALR